MTDERENRNAVFSAQATANTPLPPVPQAVQAPKDDLFTVPTQLAPLPSSGLVYPSDHPFHGAMAVEIKAMTTREEDILTSAALAKKGTILTELIRSCLVDKRVEPADLLVSDRYALLYAIRITGYGHLYEEEASCSECGMSTSRQFDMSKFPIKRLEIKPIQPGVNEFAFKLPVSGRDATFRFLTGRDEEEMHLTAERQKKIGTVIDTGITSAIQRSLVSVSGVTDRTKLAMFAQKMLAGDSIALREYMGKNSPGVQFTEEQACSACGHVEEVSMPMGLGFLWPHAKR